MAKPSEQDLPCEVNSRGWRQGQPRRLRGRAAPRREGAAPRPRGGRAGEPQNAKEPRLNHAARRTNRLENGPTEQQECTFLSLTTCVLKKLS